MRTFKDYCNLSEEQLRPIEMLLRYVAAEPREFELLLENNIQLMGYSMDEYVYTTLAAECSSDEEDYFGDTGVQVCLFPPASGREMTEVMPLDEYYAYLEDYANCYLANKSQEEKQRIYAKLAKVKEAFRHAK